MHPTQSAIQANIPHNIPTARTHAPMNKHTATQAKITEKTSKKKNATPEYKKLYKVLFFSEFLDF